MQTHATASSDQTEQLQSGTVPQTAQLTGERTAVLEGNHPEAVVQRQMQTLVQNSPQMAAGRALQAMMNDSPQAREMQTIQRMVNAGAPKANNTGLPDNLKAGIEGLSGHSMDGVKVHYNSDKPAQLQAHAYAQGADIHLAPGQERHLPHEAWHVVQQKQGRVKPTIQMKGGVPVNDDKRLEREADIMGAKALQMRFDPSMAKDKGVDAARVPPSSSGATPQLKEMEVQAIGVTHLVRLNESGSLYQPDYIGNEVAETQSGDAVLIETDKALRSRRGPNQELDRYRDQNKKPENTWINALEFNKRELPSESYIREGTFKEKPEKSGLSVSKKEQEEAEKKGSLLLSYDIPVSGPVYLIDASHRGDMYQLRAALAVENHPLIVYNVKGENDLTNYLSNAPGVDIHKLPYNPAAPEEQDFIRGRVYRSLEVHSESDATKIIVSAPKKAGNIKASMATVPEPCIEAIEAAVDTVFKGISGNVALLMYRDSGQTNLVYPELDSGDALPTLGAMMHKKGFLPVFCGAPESESVFRNIGPYWNALKNIPELAGEDIPKENPQKFKRDIEAEFMKRAYEKGKFSIVVGFRSGALDLFTLLGIPTISIGLKNLVGEDRHSKYVGNPTWKRTNIQYDVPRSNVTKLTKGRGESKLYMSPFWKMRSTETDESVKKEKYPTTADAPRDFHPADLDTVSKGLDIGIAKLKGKKPHNEVVTRSQNPLDDMPEELHEISLSVEQEQKTQKEIGSWWMRRAELAVEALRIRTLYELELNQESEKGSSYVSELTRQEMEKEIESLHSYLDHRTKIQEEKIKSASKVRKPTPKQEPKKKVEKPLSKNANKVFQILTEALPGRISLPDSENEEAVQSIFGMSSAEFFEAYRELGRRKIAKADKDGPYLL